MIRLPFEKFIFQCGKLHSFNRADAEQYTDNPIPKSGYDYSLKSQFPKWGKSHSFNETDAEQ